jgi:TnpA family transposase
LRSGPFEGPAIVKPPALPEDTLLDKKPSSYATLAPLIGGTVNRKQITGHWDEILRLATSIKHGSVTASL